MTPRRFDPDSVHAKLEQMSSVLDDLASVGKVEVGRLRREAIVRGAVERFLTQLVDLAVAVNAHVGATLVDEPPTDYAASFGVVAKAGAVSEELARDLAPSVGLRNVLVHEYAQVDYVRVAASVPLALDRYRRYVRQMSEFLEQHETDHRVT